MAEKGIIILDTNIVIEIIRQNIEIIKKCDDAGTENLALTSITRIEFLLGSKDKLDFERNRKFIDKFKLIRMDESVDKFFTSLYDRFALSHRPGIPDMLIAATALYYDCQLYTLNTKDFQFIPELRLFA